VSQTVHPAEGGFSPGGHMCADLGETGFRGLEGGECRGEWRVVNTRQDVAGLCGLLSALSPRAVVRDAGARRVDASVPPFGGGLNHWALVAPAVRARAPDAVPVQRIPARGELEVSTRHRIRRPPFSGSDGQLGVHATPARAPECANGCAEWSIGRPHRTGRPVCTCDRRGRSIEFGMRTGNVEGVPQMFYPDGVAAFFVAPERRNPVGEARFYEPVVDQPSGLRTVL